MQALLAIPMEFRLIALGVLGLCVGSLLNAGIYSLAWAPRAIGPWLRPVNGAPTRRLFDCVPVLGWLGMRREAALHGTGFWIRPMLLELSLGAGFASLYWWEVGLGRLLPAGFPRPFDAGTLHLLHCQYAAHLVLISLMLVASLIDMDEKTIPDAITVPGALAGLSIAALWPQSLLPDAIPLPGGAMFLSVLHVAAPSDGPALWPNWLDGRPHAWPLAAGLACLWGWCFAVMPRSWHARHGFYRAVRLCAARMARHWTTYAILGAGLVGSWAMMSVWNRGGMPWVALFSALAGMAFSGGLIWLVRIIGTAVLRREAMGFGDVTLMAMIGAFLGWQTSLMVFFLAPFAGLLVGIVRLVLHSEDEIPYGPFLCLAALFAIVFWAPVWGYVQGFFSLGWIVIGALLVCLALMAVLLPVVRWGLSLLRGEEPS